MFDFRYMAAIEVGMIYDQTVKGTIMKTQKVDRGAYVLNTKPWTYVQIEYIISTSINLLIHADMRIWAVSNTLRESIQLVHYIFGRGPTHNETSSNDTPSDFYSRLYHVLTVIP